ncbi:hypothetical protein [Agreia sp. VKM Ac-1783]|uniref:hypothetical protein n=1 Tax=Agreia sp. VKM Ac-1783 TaxID=1938889 RepID=UPI000A2AEE7E|nr:hypothetical protein [Agreia sp. VKM Ac-1783]SMQ58307.1 hypothetical protein SAMN06295943_0149 [Agreia sp. VKM Ac-1783]
MIQLLGWVAFCLVLAVLVRNRPMVSVGVATGLWFLVPSIAGHLITGQAEGALSFHPATWVILTAFAVQIFANGRRLVVVVAEHILLVLVFVVVIAVAWVNTRYGTYGGGTVILVDQIVIPVLVFMLVLLGATVRSLQRFRTLLIVLTSVSVVVAIIQWSVKDTVFYAAQFAETYWFDARYDRWMGTFDQPLALSLVVCVITPLLTAVTRWWIRVPLLALMVMGALVSQSRLGIALVVLAAVYVVIATATTPARRAIGVLVTAGAVVGLAFTPIAAGVLGRLENDTGSTHARELAISFFLSDWPQFFLVGQGISSSYRVASAAGLGTSLESSILMYAIDIGIVFSVLYFGAMVYLLIRYRRSTAIRGIQVAGVLAFIIPMTYSALATRSVAGILVWSLLALVTAASMLRASELRADAANLLEVGPRVESGDDTIVARTREVL